jgi:hypothetical protein
MDCLKFQSLIGILFDGTEKKLTPVSTDIFISIPRRDYLSHFLYSEPPSTTTIPDIFGIVISSDVFN